MRGGGVFVCFVCFDVDVVVGWDVYIWVDWRLVEWVVCLVYKEMLWDCCFECGVYLWILFRLCMGLFWVFCVKCECFFIGRGGVWVDCVDMVFIEGILMF